ncbi:hypothetical protein K469DRAFT_558272, partial [Zopfia rhizophila CBS 207.26]
INYILREYLDIFIIAYLNNVLIYINGILKKYIKYTKKFVNHMISTGKPYSNIKKSKFTITKTKFLGLIISIEGI